MFGISLVAVVLLIGVALSGVLPAQDQGSGQLSGRVSVAGAPIRPPRLPVYKSRSFCGATVANETLLVSDDGALRNAVVTLQPLTSKILQRLPLPNQLMLDNQNCAFVPHVQIAPLGSELLLKNSDPILHTVHARMGSETLFNVGLPKWRQVTKSLNRPGIVRIDCDVLHTWMSAAIVVVDTPYFALSDARGEFQVAMLPTGEYQLHIWHEKLGSQSAQVSIAPNARRFLEIVYRSKESP